MTQTVPDISPLMPMHQDPLLVVVVGPKKTVAYDLKRPNAHVTSLHGHDDVIKWKHFPRCRPFVWGIHRSPVNSLHKGQWRGALMFSLICTRINGSVNNREAGDLRRHRAHYDVTVMKYDNMVMSVIAYFFPLLKTDGFPWLCRIVFEHSLIWRMSIKVSQLCPSP